MIASPENGLFYSPNLYWILLQPGRFQLDFPEFFFCACTEQSAAVIVYESWTISAIVSSCASTESV